MQVDSAGGTLQIIAGGLWTIRHVSDLQTTVDRLTIDRTVDAEIDFRGVERMDTAGATLALQILGLLDGSSSQKVLSNQSVDSILATVKRYKISPLPGQARSNVFFTIIERIGSATVEALELAACFVDSRWSVHIFSRSEPKCW